MPSSKMGDFLGDPARTESPLVNSLASNSFGNNAIPQRMRGEANNKYQRLSQGTYRDMTTGKTIRPRGGVIPRSIGGIR